MSIENRVRPWERLSALQGCISRKGYACILEAHSGLSGLVVENARVQVNGQTIEYDGIWESSLTDSATKGLPDASIVGNDSRAHTIDEILNVTTKPIIVDGDTGGEASQFEYMVKNLERMGVSAVIIEDKVFPKRNSLDGSASQDLEDPAIFAQKIQAGKEVVINDDFMIVARLESLIAGAGLQDALERAEMYIQAGVDGIMLHSSDKRPDDILAFAEAYKPLCRRMNCRPVLVCVPTTYNTITDAELVGHGFNIIIHANHLLRAAFKAMNEAAVTILESGHSLKADPLCAPVAEIFTTVGADRINRMDRERAEDRLLIKNKSNGAAALPGHRR